MEIIIVLKFFFDFSCPRAMKIDYMDNEVETEQLLLRHSIISSSKYYIFCCFSILLKSNNFEIAMRKRFNFKVKRKNEVSNWLVIEVLDFFWSHLRSFVPIISIIWMMNETFIIQIEQNVSFIHQMLIHFDNMRKESSKII